MIIHKFQPPYGHVAEVTIIGYLHEGHEAFVEVPEPGIGVYRQITDAERVIVASGFESSTHRAYFRIYQAAHALWVARPAVSGQGQAGRLIAEPQSAPSWSRLGLHVCWLLAEWQITCHRHTVYSVGCSPCHPAMRGSSCGGLRIETVCTPGRPGRFYTVVWRVANCA